MNSTALVLQDVVVSRGGRGDETIVLAGINLTVQAGEILTIGVEDDQDAHVLCDVLQGRLAPIYGSVVPGGATVVHMHCSSDAMGSMARGSGNALVVVGSKHSVHEITADRRLLLQQGAFVPYKETEARWPSREVETATRIRLQRAGCPYDIAELVAHLLVDADMHGHPGHGVQLLPTYLARVSAGGIDPQARPAVVKKMGAVSVLSAQGGFGQLAAWEAANECARAACVTGISAVAVRHNNHVGMLSAYRVPFVHEGVVGLIATISGPSVAAPGGRRAAIGNNAICVIAPQGRTREPFVIDLATGVVACGRIRQAADRHECVPADWLLDASGAPTKDPAALDAGGSVPVFGGYKGFAISLLIEVLAGIIAGSTVSSRVCRQRVHLDTPMGCSQLFLGLLPAAFAAGDIGTMLDELRATVASSQEPNIGRFPGDVERDNFIDASQHGIALPVELAATLGLSVG